jgi:two-component SAPR family response regulator
MKLREKIILPCLFFFFPLTASSPYEPLYGLKFHAYSYEPEMRTSLDLSPDDFFSLPEGFSMSFDVKFEFKEIQSYGYVFRIIDKGGNTIDFVLSEKNISFSSSLGDIIFSKTFDEVKLLPGQWMNIRLKINIKTNELEVGVGDVTQNWTLPGIENFKEVRIVFGKNNYPETQSIDVPDMTIKDIKIENENTTLYHWKLSKYIFGGVCDELKNHFAGCENPDWVLNQNTVWKKESTFTCGINPYIAYNPDENTVAVADQRLFYTFSLSDRLLKKQPVNKEFSFTRYANQMIYNPADSAYCVYNLVKEGDGREFAAFDPATGAWAETTPHKHYSDYWHHNRYLSIKNSKLYLFGGYGHHRYKKDVFMYDVSDNAWSRKTLKGDNIEPRYLSGLGVINDSCLLRFGGYGSKTGNQELSPQHYYNAYIIDIGNMTAKKIWTLETPEENFVVSNSLVVDTANNYFYALCYPFTKFNTAVTLYKFSLTEPKYEILADTILSGFKDTGSYVDLFLDKTNHKLIAVTASSNSIDSIASISIYSLSYPPLKKSDLHQPVKPENKIRKIIILMSVLGILVLFSIIFLRKKRKANPDETVDTKNDTVAETSKESETTGGISAIKTVRKQAISLFGGFQVIDKNGNNLTTEFKPLVKNLFLLVLLHTIKNGKGISFLKLKEMLWFDMTEENAQNNRGVAMSKIRQIMKQVGDVRFLKRGLYWTIEFGDDIYCDYYESLVLIRKIKESKEININDIKKLLSIVSEGELLPNMQIDWADAFKSDFSDELVDLFMNLIRKKETLFSDATYIDIANTLFIHDPLNEDALKLKCSVLVKMGKNGLAKNTYLAFAKEYVAWFGADYKYSFSQIVSSFPEN